MEIARLRSGREVTVRPIHADDARRLEAAYERLSPESRYRREGAIDELTVDLAA